MARKYEYVIHGRPLSPDSPQNVQSPQKTLSVRKDHNRASNLRALYRNSVSPTDDFEHEEATGLQVPSNPTSPQFPPTPPVLDEQEGCQQGDEVSATQEADLTRLRSLPITPVNANSPPTPDETPPREQLKFPQRPFLALRPSIASTRAESFRTAREHIPETGSETPPLLPIDEPAVSSPVDVSDLNGVNGIRSSNIPEEDLYRLSDDTQDPTKNKLPSSDPVATVTESSQPFPPREENLNTAQKVDGDMIEFAEIPRAVVAPENASEKGSDFLVRAASVHNQVTMPAQDGSRRTKSLRDRLKQSKPLNTASTEAFAHVIGWNDGGENVSRVDEGSSTRWSGVSNLSAVEAYVVDSPIKSRKRGTLRKVVKNDSLRTVSSPIPQSNRTSMLSASGSPHRLVHKKQKLDNQHRWSTGSEVSKRSLSWGSASVWHKHEVIKVAVIPERRSSWHTSTSSSRRHSRSVSATSGQGNVSMPPVSSAFRRKRALSDSQEKSSPGNVPPEIPARSSSLSAPTSRVHSRSNSITSHQLSVQREQAENDLRSTLERMESERLSTSLRRDSAHSSPTPAPKEILSESTKVGRTEPSPDTAEKIEAIEDYPILKRPLTIEINGIAPGTKEWADLRPATITGTPFSQASMISASPDIVEARVVNFFPHNNESLQLIEPYRLSETPAVKALKAQNLGRANTVATTKFTMTTPKTSGQLVIVENADSPLRNPRKPPEPPTLLSFAIIPPTPQDELNAQLGATPDTSPVKARTGNVVRRRPSLQGRDRSESFIKSLSRGFSLRNAKNPKADQELDSTLHPFWRPRAFWDDDDYHRRLQQEREREQAGESTVDGANTETTRGSHPSNHKLTRSTSLALGPASLIRRVTEKRKQRRFIDDHLAQQQALVKQSSYSSLQRFRAGRRLYGMPPLRSLSLNLGIGRLAGLKERMASSRARREDERREMRRERLRKSIGPEVVMQSDSRFPSTGNEPASEQSAAMDELMEAARAEDLVRQRGLRL